MKFWARTLLLALGLGLLQASAQDVVNRRIHKLQRGINTSIWFAQAPGHYDVERLRTFTTDDDLKLIHDLGFDHIRLSIDAVPLTAWQHEDADGVAFMAELDRVIKTALDDGLAVIIDVHPEGAYKKALLQGTDSVDAYVSMWVAMAKHFGTLDPERVFFEFMNEPEQTDWARWDSIENNVATQVRQAAPAFTLIAAPYHYSGLIDLLGMKPLALDNVIYTFHDYDPMVFTHQGATWVAPLHARLSKVPYPSTPANIAPNLAQEPTLWEKFSVSEYGYDHWDAKRIENEVEYARAWADQNHVPIYCGEFGVHRTVVDPADRDRWLHDMRVALEKNGIGWAMWDYQTDFGVVTKADGTTTPDAGVVDALGLKLPKH